MTTTTRTTVSQKRSNAELVATEGDIIERGSGVGKHSSFFTFVFFFLLTQIIFDDECTKIDGDPDLDLISEMYKKKIKLPGLTLLRTFAPQIWALTLRHGINTFNYTHKVKSTPS